jgi:hypothetical protein
MNSLLIWTLFFIANLFLTFCFGRWAWNRWEIKIDQAIDAPGLKGIVNIWALLLALAVWPLTGLLLLIYRFITGSGSRNVKINARKVRNETHEC